jgi:hypothetical protein
MGVITISRRVREPRSAAFGIALPATTARGPDLAPAPAPPACSRPLRDGARWMG